MPKQLKEAIVPRKCNVFIVINNKYPTPHLLIHSFDHPEHNFGATVEEEGRERGKLLGRGYSIVFGLLSWHCIGYLY
jgi:hypothetical protein